MIYINVRFLTKKITGLERYASEILLALRKISSDVILLSPRKALNQSYTKNFDVEKLGFFNEYIWEQFELPFYLIKHNKPILINLTNTAPLIYKNQILVIHDLAFIHNPRWYTRKAALSFKYLVTKSAKACKKIITVSNFSKQEIVKYLNIPSEKIYVVPGAVPTNILKLGAGEYNNRYGEYILSVSSIEPRKNILNLIKAFIILNKPNLKLLIVGDVNKKVFNHVDLTKTKENILFLGYVPDEQLVGLYKNARLFAYLSYYEGFGFPPLEALSCGCQTLVSNTSSLPEVCGSFAHYCSPANVDDIVEKMKLILEGKQKIESQKLYEIKTKYNWQKSAKAMLDLANETN